MDLQHLLPSQLQHHSCLVHRLSVGPDVAHCPLEILHKAIKMVVGDLEHGVGLCQRAADVVRGTSQGHDQVIGHRSLDGIHLRTLKEHVEPLVTLDALELAVHHTHHPLQPSQALEQLVGPLQLVLLLRQLHTHCTPRCDIRPGAVQQDDRVVHGHLLHAHVKASGLKEVHHGIKMIVGDVAIVVGWAELGNVVGYLAAEAPSEIITELPSDLPLLRLGPLKMESHPGILNAPVEHVLDGGLHVLVAPEAVKQALTVFHDHTIHGVPAVAENVGADGLQGHQHLIN
mmetsp:Transcript_23958/g.54643  ORF Transcript_23958/g.54643 Transcript_23958/m.54643 type:complete len:286 (+) Transcript_23958:1334-2191(+)